ncbi:MAG: prolipoprotein diacylglyceryl transferase [Acidobacteria bacterium]|nr:prolipoprotein diacylglyceryl transferase [Acidobacteriota bacterium]
MYPYLVDLGFHRLPLLGNVHVALPSYGFMVALALVVGWFWYQREARRAGIPGDQATSVLFWVVLIGLIGAKAALVVIEADWYLADPWRVLSADFFQAAGVVWAAVLAGAGTLLFLAWRRALPLGQLADAMALPLPLAQALGRAGCLLAGCCFGSECALPWAVTYHSSLAHERTGVPLGVPLHPAPVYEMLWCLAIVLPALVLLRRHRRFPGEVTLAYFALYGTGRFLVEFARGDDVRGLWFGGTLSTSQVISLAAVPLALATWGVLRRRVTVRPAP